MSARLRVVIAEPDSTLRSALHLLLAHEDGLRLVGEAANGDELLHVLETRNVDVLLVDWELPGWNPAGLNGHLTGVRVVALGGRPEWRGQVLANGAHAFVSKLDSPSGLVRVLSDTRRYDPD
jgi:two-component system NarL family response regulator